MLDFVLNFLFPPVCGICGKLDRNWLCFRCKKRLDKYEKFNQIRGKENINILFNFQNEKIYFDEFLYCFEYKNLVRNLLLKYKFSDCGYLSNMFVNIMLNNKKVNEIFENYDIMIPVPIDKNKRLIRGYNQTELITNEIEKKFRINDNLNLKFDFKYYKQKNRNQNFYLKNNINSNKKIIINNDILVKIKTTKTQSTLAAEKRRENIKDAFRLKEKQIIENKKIILFDDIATTGSTVNEISKILKENGAREVLVLVIAKD